MDRANPPRTLRRVAMIGRFGPPLMAFSRNCRAEGIEAQPPQSEKLARADHVIDNSGAPESTIAAVRALWEALQTTR